MVPCTVFGTLSWEIWYSFVGKTVLFDGKSGTVCIDKIDLDLFCSSFSLARVDQIPVFFEGIDSRHDGFPIHAGLFYKVGNRRP